MIGKEILDYDSKAELTENKFTEITVDRTSIEDTKSYWNRIFDVEKEWIFEEELWEKMLYCEESEFEFSDVVDEKTKRVIESFDNVHWETLDKIVTDDTDIYQYACSLKKQSYTHVPCEIQYYQDKLLPLYKLYSLETGLQQALSEKVWLKSGGFLIIQQTEAFVVIDVNSGKNASKKQAETEYKKINLEAASEIARQLRLRNLSGSILIDFINMKQYEDQTELLSVMKHLVKTDRVQTTVVDVTGLGIMELTRKKAEKSLAEQWKELTGGAHKYE